MGVPPKSCTSVTVVTVDKIVMELGEECTMGTVTGPTTSTTSKSMKYNDHNENDCHHQRCDAPRN